MRNLNGRQIMASYVKKYFEEFIPEGDLKEALLTQSPCQKIWNLSRK